MTLFRTTCLFLFLAVSLPAAAQIEWMSWEEAVAANKKEPRKLLVDVYTDWCGWCKKMDKTSFADPTVVAFVNEHFYAVKFNAEQKKTIKYQGHEFKFNPEATRRGVHDLAIALLDSRMSYPSLVYLDEQRDRISISPGFKTGDKLLSELTYVQGGHYKTKTYQEFLASKKR